MIARVALDQQHARPDAAEFHFAHVAGLAAVEAHVVGAESVRQRGHEQQWRVEPFDADEQPALGRIGPDFEETVLRSSPASGSGARSAWATEQSRSRARNQRSGAVMDVSVAEVDVRP